MALALALPQLVTPFPLHLSVSNLDRGAMSPTRLSCPLYLRIHLTRKRSSD